MEKVRPALLVLALLLTAATFSAAQPAASCVAPDCPLPSDQVRAARLRIDQFRQEFETAVGRLAAVLTSPGTDGALIRSSIESLSQAGSRWDAEIEAFERKLSVPRTSNIETRLALATTYLERRRLDAAQRELDEAARLTTAPRADLHLLMARAYEEASRLSDALGPLVKASAAEPDNLMTRYELARLRKKLGQENEARDDLAVFRVAAEKRVLESRSTESIAAQVEAKPPLPLQSGDGPIFAPVIYSQSFAALEQGAFQESVRRFERAAALDPIVVDSSESLTRGRLALRGGDLATALTHLQAAVQSPPVRAEAHRVLGTAYWIDGQLDPSIEEVKAAILANPRDERSWATLSEVLVSGGRLADAERLLKEAVKIFPESGLAHYNLGRLYHVTGKYSDASLELEQAARLRVLGGGDALFKVLGTIYAGVSDFEHAAEAQTRLIAMSPRSAEAHQKLGEARVGQDRYEEALAEFLMTLLIDPKRSDALGAAAQVYLRTGHFAEAAEMARRAVELDPALKNARYALGTALIRLGRPEEGNRQLDEFRRLQEQAAASDRRKFELEHIERDAVASLSNAEYEKAAGLLQQAITYESAAPTYLALGFALLEAGRHAEAVVNLKKASELQAGPDAHRYLAEAYRALGRLDESRMEQELYRHAMEDLKTERLRKMNGGS